MLQVGSSWNRKNWVNNETPKAVNYFQLLSLKNQYAALRTNSDQADYRAGTVSFDGTTDGTPINTGQLSDDSTKANVTSHSSPSGNMRSDMSEMDSSGVFVTSSSGQTSAGWRTNYRGDYRDQPTQPITTKDLICWAFQIARGMSYLAKRKVTILCFRLPFQLTWLTLTNTRGAARWSGRS